ncbi:NagC family transcriptional regulator [Sphingobium amiense]|uniref:NagC family transcriptional regulator n=2 Tax=Sphingobium amiense TaxID=135719 RepID=A0A494W3E4_9SPHN|nr:NagC family transcriptional regulator [Sphingobium amiense]
MGALCERVEALDAQAGALEGRLLTPRIGGRRQSWDRTVLLAAKRLAQIVARHGSGSVALHVGGGMLIEDLYVANKLVKGFLGSGHIHAPGAGGGAAAQRFGFGEDVVPATGEHVDRAEMILIAGFDPGRSHPVLMERISAARADHDAQVIVLAPAFEDACDLHVGATAQDSALLVEGLLLHCRNMGLLDELWLRDHVAVPDDFWMKLRHGRDLWSLARRCGMSVADLRALFDRWARTPAAVTLYPQDDVALAAAVGNLHVATGRIGRSDAAPFPVPASAHGMALRETGCVAYELAAHRGFDAQARAQVARFWGARAMAEEPGLESDALLDAMADGRVKALWSIGEAGDDAGWLAQARASVPLAIRSTAQAGEEGWDFEFPAPVWVEKDGTLTGLDRLISRHRRLLDLPCEARPDWWAMTRVAQAMGWGDAFHYERPADIYREHVRLTAYGNDGARVLNLKRHAPISNPAYDELTPWRWGEVPFEDGRFATPDGRARLIPPQSVAAMP